MSLNLPIPFKPIEKAIVIDGVTEDQILKVAHDVRSAIDAEKVGAVNPKYEFNAASLNLSPGKLGALRNHVREYIHAVEKLATEPDNIHALITVGALPAPLWNRVADGLWRDNPQTLLSVLNEGGKLSDMTAQDLYAVMGVLQSYGYDTPEHSWELFINDITGTQSQKSTLKYLTYLGDKALEAADMFKTKTPLDEITQKLGLTNNTYAAWAVILGTRCQQSLQEEKIPPSHWGNVHFTNAYNARFTVGDSNVARAMFTEDALAEFLNAPNRQAFFRLRYGDIDGMKITL